MMTTFEHAGADIANAMPYNDLPDGHLFRLVRLGYDSVNNFYDDEGNERMPAGVNWAAVLERLQTDPEEVRQWVQTRGTKCFLFLHYLLDFDYGEKVADQGDESGDASISEEPDANGEQQGGAADAEGTDGETEERSSDETQTQRVLESVPVELQVILLAIDMYREAVKIPDSRGYYPLHLVCRCGQDFYPDFQDSSAGPFSWRRISNKVFEEIFHLYPDAASVRLSDGRTALHCLCGAAYHNEEPVDAMLSLLNVYPEAASIPDGQGLYPLHTFCTSGFHYDYVEPSPRVIQALLEAYPKALHFPDRENGYYPLHIACIETLSATTIKSFVKKFPQATRVRSKTLNTEGSSGFRTSPLRGGRTPLLENLRRCNQVDSLQYY